MEYQYLQLQRADGCATVWLNRPTRHNAFHAGLIAELRQCLGTLSTDSSVRVVVLAARGASFCAGADLQWMREQADAAPEDNLADARALAALLQTLAQLPKPTVARVQGVVLGGGLGLVAACDLALAERDAVFGTTEVRLGLTPSTIAPFVVAAMGERAARRYFLTGERFDAAEALRLGLVHEVTEAGRLDAQLRSWVARLREGAPLAQAHCKQLLRALRQIAPEAVPEHTARSIAEVRRGEEARAGVAAFFAKVKPPWTRT